MGTNVERRPATRKANVQARSHYHSIPGLSATQVCRARYQGMMGWSLSTPCIEDAQPLSMPLTRPAGAGENHRATPFVLNNPTRNTPLLYTVTSSHLVTSERTDVVRSHFLSDSVRSIR